MLVVLGDLQHRCDIAESVWDRRDTRRYGWFRLGFGHERAALAKTLRVSCQEASARDAMPAPGRCQGTACVTTIAARLGSASLGYCAVERGGLALLELGSAR